MNPSARTRATLVLGTLVIAVAASLAAADEDPAAVDVVETRHFVGAAGDGLFVGMDVMRPAEDGADWGVSVYLCNGQDVSTWLHGTFDGRDVSLASDGVRVELTRAGDAVYGTVDLDDGIRHAFTAAAPTGNAGLYHVDEGTEYGGGWIVLPDGRQRGAVTAGGDVVDDPSLNPATLQAESPSLGAIGACCCGLIFPCNLACCSTQPFATPSPN